SPWWDCGSAGGGAVPGAALRPTGRLPPPPLGAPRQLPLLTRLLLRPQHHQRLLRPAPFLLRRALLRTLRLSGGPTRRAARGGRLLRVLYLPAGFRGDRTDLELLRLSSLYQEVEQGRELKQYLVGDEGGHPLLP
ncbi:unnamed protein product, partial [Urochloa humidicola]